MDAKKVTTAFWPGRESNILRVNKTANRDGLAGTGRFHGSPADSSRLQIQSHLEVSEGADARRARTVPPTASSSVQTTIRMVRPNETESCLQAHSSQMVLRVLHGSRRNIGAYAGGTRMSAYIEVCRITSNSYASIERRGEDTTGHPPDARGEKTTHTFLCGLKRYVRIRWLTRSPPQV